jgi:hypothetical protein
MAAGVRRGFVEPTTGSRGETRLPDNLIRDSHPIAIVEEEVTFVRAV